MPSATVGFLVLPIFSFVLILSGIRLVAESRKLIAILQCVIDERGMARMLGLIEPPQGFAAHLSIRRVIPIFFGLTTSAPNVWLVVYRVL